ncbi:MAG: mannonate dehydratase, partial [Gammaproteobacteria bacterium]|nr:mannonate dehydratase [Gammaproteobacteria bacterium]
LRHLSEQKEIHSKLLFGTDYPVPFSISVNGYDMDWDRRRQINKIENPFDRYAQAMLYYFPVDNPIYSNYQKILS